MKTKIKYSTAGLEEGREMTHREPHEKVCGLEIENVHMCKNKHTFAHKKHHKVRQLALLHNPSHTTPYTTTIAAKTVETLSALNVQTQSCVRVFLPVWLRKSLFFMSF